MNESTLVRGTLNVDYPGREEGGRSDNSKPRIDSVSKRLTERIWFTR